jgi:hypothetical protein
LDAQNRHAGIKARGGGNEKRGEGFLSPCFRERILLIDEVLKGPEKENQKQAQWSVLPSGMGNAMFQA